MQESGEGQASARVIDDLDQLVFRRRASSVRDRRDDASYRALWIGLAFAGAVVLVFLVRALLDRTAGTAGASQAPMQPVAAQQRPESMASNEALQQDTRIQAPPSMVYRCVGKGGAVSLQSQPCSGDQRETRAIYAPPDAEPIRRRIAATPGRPAEVVYDFPAPANDPVRDQRRVTCAIAKSTREKTLASVGLDRTYDLLQRLDEMVREACKGK